jgi:hypothetical protein
MIRRNMAVPGARWCSRLIVPALLIGALLPAPISATEPEDEPYESTSYPPQPAPPIVTDDNYEVVAHPPDGLTYCRPPKGWVGSYHGDNYFLQPPPACQHGETTADEPVIQMFYAFNAAFETRDQLGRQECENRAITYLPGFILLGETASGCKIRTHGSIKINLVTTYNLEDMAEHDNNGDAYLVLTLSTTPTRFDHDLSIFKQFAVGLSLCSMEDNPEKRHLPACIRINQGHDSEIRNGFE